MSTYSSVWNGSTLAFNGVGVAPLRELSQPNEPDEFETSGSTDSGHTAGAGLPKNSFTASCLGSNVPAAGSVVNIAASIKGGGVSPRTKNYSQAFISQCSIRGSKNGTIESSFTAMPGVSTLTPITYSNTIGDLGFNGSTFSFNSTPFTNIQSIEYGGNCTPIDSTGAEVATADTLYGPGLPRETITVTTLGPPQAEAKSIGATVTAWKDGGALGSLAHAKLLSTRPGGTVDGQTTTVHVFKPCRETATADN